jgi:hypothetical protein
VPELGLQNRSDVSRTFREVFHMPQPTGTLWRSEPRTLLKHQVYRWYLHCWMGKICQTFPTSAIVDGFAGPGF